MILPVFALYAGQLKGVTPTLTGIAIGAYGFTQALLQIPFGMLSDRFGRKRVIFGGLVLFALGSIIAALSDSIYGVILGRALQGSGAIAAPVLALASDLTREVHRTKVMAVLGMSIGVSFAVALVVGPVLNHWIGVPGIFWSTAALAGVGMIVLGFLVPRPGVSRGHWDAEPVAGQLRAVLADRELLRLDLGIFILHAVLTASFVALPLALRDSVGVVAEHHWKVYLAVMSLSMVMVVPFIFIAERGRRIKFVFLGAIVALALAEFGLGGWHRNLGEIVTLLLLFFTAFNLLEASLPSLISKLAPLKGRGTALGVYSSVQFLGAFAGGAVGGWVYGAHGAGSVFTLCGALTLLWFLAAVSMQSPRYLSPYLLNVGRMNEQEARALAARLTQVRGVAEARVIGEEGVAYLKVDRHTLDECSLREFSAAEA